MAQESGSATTQSVRAAGQLILSFPANASSDQATATVSFSPALASITQPIFAPIQRVHVADNGTLHVFQLSTNEELTWRVDFEDLPWEDETTPGQTSGYRSLRRFVRTTLNYAEQLVTITSPDGDIETMRCLGGIETFEEASGRSGHRERWTGQLTFRRQLT